MDDAAVQMVEAATAWLAALSSSQLSAARQPWPSSDRKRWYYTPVDHGGLPLGQMSAPQQQAAMRLLSTGLSDAGYVTASTIIGLENVLDRSDNWPVTDARRRRRDPQLYWLRVFGEPSLTGPWSWRFGGHHVSVHNLVLDGRVQSSTPCFLGADPAAAPLLGGHLLRPLGATEDLARDLLASLSPDQLPATIIDAVAPSDILSRNLSRVPDIGLAGIPGSALTPAQQDLLRALLGTFIDRIPPALAAAESAKFAGKLLDEVHFAWAGATEPGAPHYYRLQGPSLLAEYDNTQSNANHVHTVWRNPTNDFGDDVLARHLADHHS
ncbi:DUF3500 domain-containing protein [Symbioplanes lichenis]|uniref:DUF3500 domain-containing protein n=1 Tax=Symbioplanes lichenis TaxID=1629072 RepID=UPI00273A2BAF|nr:DUF3500 domain-containing protein [Actinoplanes lichenis]